MSIILDIFCLDVPFMILFYTVLYVATGVGGCGWTIYDMVVRMDVAYQKFSNNHPNYAQ